MSGTAMSMEVNMEVDGKGQNVEGRVLAFYEHIY